MSHLPNRERGKRSKTAVQSAALSSTYTGCLIARAELHERVHVHNPLICNLGRLCSNRSLNSTVQYNHSYPSPPSPPSPFPSTTMEFIQQAFSPVVVLMVSADAEKSCQKSCLSFSDLLAPFVRFKGEEEKEGKEKAGVFFSFFLFFFLLCLACTLS